ncbi:MAG: hypothetical protein HYV07_14245 [Deltaproteobacteria bacterium]|nr:hypothetical protein [Deltaproteobacteria bacterium]
MSLNAKGSELVSRTDAPALPSTRFEARAEVSQLFGLGDDTVRRVIATDVRATLDLEAASGFQTNVDGRARLGWNDDSRDRFEVQSLSIGYRTESGLRATLGRVTLSEVAAAEVDGIVLGYSKDSKLSIFSFGGLGPHPLTGALDSRFVTAGLGYGSRRRSIEHAGGASLSLFNGELDRLFVTQRVHTELAEGLRLYVRAVVECLSPKGIGADLADEPSGSAIEKIDLSNGALRVSYKVSKNVSLAAEVDHVHALVPNRFWQDYLQEVREARGFTNDGPLPAGSRRSIARVTANTHFGLVSPYAVLRGDFRHEDSAKAFEAKGGVKLDVRDAGFIDLSFTERRHFEADNRVVSLGGGFEMGPSMLDARISAMRMVPANGGAAWLYDLDATFFVDLDSALNGVFALASYALFVEPETIYHLGLARVGVRIPG